MRSKAILPPRPRLALCVAGILVLRLHALSGQAVDPLGFRALPRPVTYGVKLAPAGGPVAVIVCGRNAPWTRKGAEAVQAAVRDWSGKVLEVIDDQTVTSDETWLLRDEYRRIPLILLGNGQDNRVLHALSTRSLDHSNRYWPGGDRYIIRTLFEPFVADVNGIVLCASTEAGLDAATTRFRQVLEALPKGGDASLPLTRINGGGKDTWRPASSHWQVPAGYAAQPGEAVAAIAARAAAAKADTPAAGEPLANVIGSWAVSAGDCGSLNMVPELGEDETTLRSLAAFTMNGCRAAGGRTHTPFHHYGAMAVITSLRGILQTGILNAAEVNEVENFFTLSGAYPSEYYYDHIGSDSGFIDYTGGRHCCACLLITVHTLDYVLDHCRMEEPTRREIERRAEGARRATARYLNSFRDNLDTWELGESTMMTFLALLHQGMPEVIRNGNLRRMADAYLLTTDNLRHRYWKYIGLYAGLDSYIGASPGVMSESWHGRGLVAAAAFYYDDPQYRWFVRESQEAGGIHGIFGSVATALPRLYWDPSAPVAEPARLFGVRALPFDPRLYGLAATPGQDKRWHTPAQMRVPAPIGRLVDRASIRDGISADDAYLFLATSQRVTPSFTPLQNNAIARYTDLDEIWLYHNTMLNTGWGRNVVSISNGKSYVPAVACALDAMSSLGDARLLATTEPGVAGADWTRSLIHWPGHYTAVLDSVRALADDEFNLICRWRTPNVAELGPDGWTALAGEARMRIQTTDLLPQVSEQWECDGSGRPFVLTQYQHASLRLGQRATFQNLVWVSSPKRPDEFTARRLSPAAMLVKGHTAQGELVALLGTGEGPLPLPGFAADAAVYAVIGNQLHLAQTTRLAVRADGTDREVFRADAPVNLWLDFESGNGLVEESPLGKPDFLSTAKPWQVDVAGLPKPAELLERLWAAAPAPASRETATAEVNPKRLQVTPAAAKLALPRQRFRRAVITSTPPASRALRELTDGQSTAHLSSYTPTWVQSDNLEVTIDLGEPVRLAQLRLVGTLKPGSPGEPTFGVSLYEPGDFTFTLALSNDGFAKDVRSIPSPRVEFEETALYPIWHYAMGRLPTFVVNVDAEARSVRLMPRATTKERPGLSLTELEIIGSASVNDLGLRAFAADVDGDGDAELVTGTSARQVAVLRSDGRQAWSTILDGDIFSMGCDDLDQDGRSEILVYTTREQLHRFNGDGTERPRGDIHQAYIKEQKWCGVGGMITLAAWAPDGADSKEVMLWSEGCCRVLGDGTVKLLKSAQPRGAGRLVDLVPNEPEVLVTTGFRVDFWSRRRDQDGNYIRLASKEPVGDAGGPLMRGFGWVQAVNQPGHQGVLAANNGGLNYWPVAAISAENAPGGWSFDNGGVPNVAALLADGPAPGQARVFLARLDGFVNVFDLDGKKLGLLNAAGPVLGMAALGMPGTPQALAVCTRFGLSLYDADLQLVARRAGDAVAFAGPVGKERDRVCLINAAGEVSVCGLRR